MDELTQELAFGDMSKLFDFEEERAEYLDGPISGWVRRREDGVWLAYDCQTIVPEKLWHWILVAADKGEDHQRVLAEAAARTTGSWLSVVEDRRSSDRSQCRLVTLPNPPPHRSRSSRSS